MESEAKCKEMSDGWIQNIPQRVIKFRSIILGQIIFCNSCIWCLLKKFITLLVFGKVVDVFVSYKLEVIEKILFWFKLKPFHHILLKTTFQPLITRAWWFFYLWSNAAKSKRLCDTERRCCTHNGFKVCHSDNSCTLLLYYWFNIKPLN